MYYTVVFKSRTNAIKFYDIFRRAGADALLINTPKSLGAGCGLSVRLDDFLLAKRILSGGGYSYFYGIYEYVSGDYERIY